MNKRIFAAMLAGLLLLPSCLLGVTAAPVSGEANITVNYDTDLGPIKPLYLVVNNLPWGNAPFAYERYELTQSSFDAGQGLEHVESASQTGASFTTTETLAGMSVAVARLRAFKVYLPIVVKS